MFLRKKYVLVLYSCFYCNKQFFSCSKLLTLFFFWDEGFLENLWESNTCGERERERESQYRH